jgi:peptidoglycan/xylan/chitin deacetylase (PgdA/CDA1 family)
VTAIFTATLLAVIACLGSAVGPSQTQLAGGRDHGDGQQAPGTGPRAIADDGPGSPDRPPDNMPGNSSASPAPAASQTPTPTPTAPPGAGAADPLARIPKFPPAPPAVKITLPQGPAAAWLSRIPTSQKVAFITIDDGWTKQPEAVQLVQAAHVPVTLFLTINAIRSDPGYFKQLQAAGAVIEAHTLTHADLKGKSSDFQRREICGSADQLGAVYGRRPVLFRPPFGDKDVTTLQVTHECGMKAAFFWKETVDKGVVRFQEGHTVQAGDIILMHFRPAFTDDFLAALQAIHDAGLTPALLEDYIP